MAQAKIKVVWTREATGQLERIASFIASDNLDAAAELLTKCLEATDRLALFPESGRVVPEARKRSYREVIVAPCRIIYRREGGRILVVHVIRGERRLRTRDLH